jgi:predicted GH43/DUF377 family glycosyl hydrolase
MLNLKGRATDRMHLIDKREYAKYKKLKIEGGCTTVRTKYTMVLILDP